MAYDYDSTQGEFFRPLVTGWLAKIEAALTCGPRKHWKEIADECLMFYSKSAAAMWDPLYSRKFWRNVKAPKFRITINKAFELVAVFGPNLLWDTPHRTVHPKKLLELPPDLFQLLPDLAEQAEAIQAAMATEMAQDKITARLMEQWLNYLPHEQPGGGLEGHSERAVIDALITGRGCLWTAPYKFPSSDRQLIGSFRDKPERLLIDPDFTTLDEAKYIVRIHQDPHWAVEKRFDLPANSLKGKATLESGWHYAEMKGTDDRGMGDRQAGKTNDLVLWYEVFSKMGVGSRMTGMPDDIKYHLDEVVGDYAYLAICPTCPYPLNCPTDKLRSGATDKEVQHLFSWPVPMWADDRWPVEVLDFYPDPESAYPIAPLAPGLGELKFLNFLVPWACNRIYTSSRDFWAVLGSHHDHFLKYLQEGEDQTVIPIPPSSGSDDIKKIVTVLQQPETRFDVWKIIELVSTLFDKRTGLTEFAYGRNEDGTQNRTAEETMAKKNAVGVRPEHMQKKVVSWQSRVSAVEAMLTYLFVKAKDVTPRMGHIGGLLWQRFIENAEGEQIFRQMNYTVAAASIRRPNRDRDVANFQQASDKWLPVAQAFGTATGVWDPVNGLMKKWAEYHDTDMSEAYLVPPPPDPAMQAMQEAELTKTQAEAQKLAAEAQANPAELKLAELQMEQEAQGAELEMDLVKMQAELQMDAQKHQMEMQQKQEEGQLNLALKAQQGQQQIQMGRQQMVQQAQQHAQQIQQGDQQHRQQLKQGEQQTQAKVQAMKAQAKVKPKPAGAGK